MEEVKTDVLVIGSGIAGLMYAIKVAAYGSVALVTKKEAMDSSTNLAQGGIASVFDSTDSFDIHIDDTLASGDGLCKRDAVERVVQAGPALITELMDMGVKFNPPRGDATTRSDQPAFDLGREGGHSRNRIVHALDKTGQEVERVLVDRARNHPNITFFENHMAIDLVTAAEEVSFCCGAYVLERSTRKVKTFAAHITLLATGGAGKVYRYTSNPDIATGDGMAMAYRAGATVTNMEFVQFHPTCLYHPQAKNFLISEAVRGEGGVLLDANGNAFMSKYDPLKDLACRDKVARAIDTELKKSGEESVYLDISHKQSDRIKERFPTIYAKCFSLGIDITQTPIPVVPAAHYMCGGVVTDRHGHTDIQHLYAVGETACTGLHGANRLASNSLLEALVYADAAAKQTIKELKADNESPLPEPKEWDEVGTTDSDEMIMVAHNWDEIRSLMWNYVGIVRSDKRLERAQRRIEIIGQEIHDYYWNFKVVPDLIELRNIAVVAELIIKCALHRKESRGLHYTLEYPKRDDQHWRKDTVLRRSLVK